MQDRYIGDIGDFGKFGLLRALIGCHPVNEQVLHLGIVWYAFHPEDLKTEEAKKDGKHVSYLENDYRKLAVCDPDLYKKLGDIISSNQRQISSISKANLFASKPVFYDRPLSNKNIPLENRSMSRKEWFVAALNETRSCQIVFLDPDNGIASNKKNERLQDAPKYVFLEEVGEFVQRGQSLVIYHHLGRHIPHKDQLTEQFQRLRSKIPRGYDLHTLSYHRGTARAFYLAFEQSHRNLLTKRLKTFLQSPWKAHFQKR